MSKLEKATDLVVFSMLRENGYIDGNLTPLKAGVEVWAEKSPNTKINALLQSASKQGSGKQGYPEYIIFDQDNDLVIIIENKKSRKNHIYSKDLSSKVSDYAVNGALWYGQFLIPQFDVIAIGISGTERENLIIDTFLWRKQSDTFNNVNTNTLLSIEKYRELLAKLKQPKTNKQILFALNERSKQINEFLRNVLGVIEHERLYVLGSILYALEDPMFKISYGQANDNKSLALAIYQTVERKVKGSNVKEKEVITDELKPVLLGLKDSEKQGVLDKYPNGSLSHLVKTVEEVLFEFHKNREIDLMSTFFNVFLSYSTSGGSDLGIVLTPPHITKLFSDIAEVSPHSKILDLCVGTGGFLTSAWKKIALNETISLNEKEQFREHNLFGVESEKSLYTIVALNMFINKDGRSNLFLKDAFLLKDELKQLDCNVGFLNPPYSDSVYSEIAFIELMLDSLLPHSIGIAIVPVNAVSSRTKKHADVLDVKRRILAKHSLIASIEMPKNLFYPKGTETVVLVFNTAEPNEQETWFARFDDSYELIKHQKSRTPTALSEKKYDDLLLAYKNRAITDFSFAKKMTYEDQWVYTVHDDFSYEILDNDLQQTVNAYVSYLYQNNYF